jgi:hypothetical protein
MWRSTLYPVEFGLLMIREVILRREDVPERRPDEELQLRPRNSPWKGSVIPVKDKRMEMFGRFDRILGIA